MNMFFVATDIFFDEVLNRLEVMVCGLLYLFDSFGRICIKVLDQGIKFFFDIG